MRRLLPAYLLALGVLWACNDHDPHPPVSGSSGSSAIPGPAAVGGGSSSGNGEGGVSIIDAGIDAGGECTDLDDPSTQIAENALNDDVPNGLGGTLIDAVYDLITAEKYVGISGQAGPNGITYQETIRITGGTSLERNRSFQNAAGPIQVTNATYVIQASGTNLTFTQQCPTRGNAETFGFTIQNGQLTLIASSGEVFTYTARP